MSAEMTPALVRAARELLGWSTETLAERAGVSVNTVNRYQYARDPAEVSVTVSNAMKIRHALQNAGVVFANDALCYGVSVMWKSGAGKPR